VKNRQLKWIALIALAIGAGLYIARSEEAEHQAQHVAAQASELPVSPSPPLPRLPAADHTPEPGTR
jgi:hypothetical protein